tara:strand:+ start:3719 stop:6127 length:2409 start_codon:yes stop_codon:yes gene_type:complete
MANKKISQLTALGSNFGATDLFEISKDVGGGAFESKKITGAEMISSISTSIAIGDTVTSGTEGSVLFLGAAGVLAQDNANFFWDDTNDRLGIGTSSPSFALHVLDASANLDTKFESNGGHSRLIIDSTGADDSILQFNEANARRWSIYTDGTDDSLKITRSDVPTASPTSDAIAIDSTDNVSIPNGTLTINDYTFPAADGSANQIIQTDGAGNLSFVAAGGGGASVLNDLTDVSVLGSGDDWSVFKNASTPNGAPTTGTFTGNRNLAIGAYSQRIITSGSDNISFGDQSLFSITTGVGNIAIGDSVLYSNSSGAYNVGIGRRVLNAATGYGNVGIGQQALTSVNSGQFNIGLGYFTTGGTQLTSGSYNINFGYHSTVNSGTASYQFALGSGHATLGDYLMSGDFSTTGAAKLGINLGKTAGGGLRPPNQPTATLHLKGQGLTSGTTSLLVEKSNGDDLLKITDDGAVTINSAFTLPIADGSANQVLQTDGAGAVSWATAGGGGGATDLNGLTDAETVFSGGSAAQFNVFLSNGSSAGAATQHGSLSNARGLIAIGPNTLKSTTSSQYNVAIGYNAGPDITTSPGNIMIGANAGLKISTGIGGNVLVGRDAGNDITAGGNNVAVGYNCLGANQTGGENVAVGYGTLGQATYRRNIAVGRFAGYGITTGQGNLAMGYNSMFANNTNSFCFAIGYAVEPSSTTVSNELTIGYGTNRYLMRGSFATAAQAKLMINPDAADTPTATLHVKGQGATNSTTSLLVENSSGTDQVEVKDDGSVFMYNLPTSDPGVSGQLWVDSGTLKVSS